LVAIPALFAPFSRILSVSPALSRDGTPSRCNFGHAYDALLQSITRHLLTVAALAKAARLQVKAASEGCN
jgi:hypothetical protein